MRLDQTIEVITIRQSSDVILPWRNSNRSDEKFNKN